MTARSIILAHRIPLSATLVAVCGFAAAAEQPVTPPPNPEAQRALEEYAKDGDVHRQGREVAGAYHFEVGNKALQDNRLDDAIKAFTTAVDYLPDNQEYRKALANVQALAGQSREARSVYVNQLGDELSVNQQKLWAEAQEKIEVGTKALASGDYHEAERNFSLAHTRLESLPYADDRKEAEQRRVEALLVTTRERRAKAELQETSVRNDAAEVRQREIREAGLQLERSRIDAMHGRALKARDRRDYDEAILLCEQILKINRAEERAHDLLVKCRRERHVYLRQVTADRWDEEHKLMSEQIRAAMLPQLELLTYSHDWHEIDARRSAPVSGAGNDQQDPWRIAINAGLQNKVDLAFKDQDLTDVIDTLRKVSGLTILLDAQVIAAGSPPVELKVTSMTLKNALDNLMRITGLQYQVRDQAIFITNEAGIQGDLSMKLYDVRDLLHGLTKFPGPDLDIPPPGGQGAQLLPPAADEAPPQIADFQTIIKEVVAPNSWTDKTAIDEHAGSLAVTQSLEVHRQIEELLRQLRNQRGTQIHAKVKFLTVNNSLLEEIGFNWNRLQAAPPNVDPNVNGTQLQGVGAYNANNSLTVAGVLNNQLIPYNTANSLSLPRWENGEGLQFKTDIFRSTLGLYASATLRAIEKDDRYNVIFEPDITLFNGQQAHLVNMNQQSYVSDYNVVQGQYDPIVSILSYGTVLDVQAVTSADKKYITFTLRPTNAQVTRWRRFGSAVNNTGPNSFPGGNVEAVPNGVAIAGGNPLLVPELTYQSARTSVTIPDGGSLLIGGMTNSESTRSHSGVPFLSHIPFLGRLFSSNGRQETELRTIIAVTGDVILFDEIEKSL